MRITTNAILRNYNKNLSTSMKNLDTMRNRVMTQRKYMSTAEDPSSALRATSLERKYAKNNDYLDTVDDIQSHQNGTNITEETRRTYADAWKGAQQSMLLSLNATYGDEYVFGGSDAKNCPFSLETVNGKQVLKYRGVDVTEGDPKALEQLSKDSHFIDLGFGLEVNDGTPPDEQYNIDPATAFNPGINLVGYGKDADGDSKNMVVLAGQIAEELAKPAGDFDYERYRTLLNKFEDGRNDLLSEVTILGTQTEFLTTTKERLENNKIQIAEDYDNVVNVDMAEAIMDFSWAQYVYNASLKVGNNILTPSFIDFMN